MRASPSVIKILALSLVLGLAACSSNKDKEILTEQEYYREARQALDKNNLIVTSDRARILITDGDARMEVQQCPVNTAGY